MKKKYDDGYDCMYDCIHLKACRRLQKIAKAKYKDHVARHCDKDCTAYCNKHNFIDENFTAKEEFELLEPELYEACMQNADVVMVVG